MRVAPRDRNVEVTDGDSTTIVTILSWRDHQLRYMEDGVQRSAVCVADAGTLHIVQDCAVITAREVSPWPSDKSALDPGRAYAPVAGTIVAISATVGDIVEAGQQLVCVEAMKMEMWLTARAAGTVTRIHVDLKQSVEAGTLLVEIDTAGGS
jgi:geranyl-CoA carboxylase alpha subunit